MTGPDAIERGSAALLAGLPRMGPARLVWFLDRFTPSDAWAHATSGRSDALGPPLSLPKKGSTRSPAEIRDELVATWARLGGHDAAALAAAHAEAEIAILLRGDDAYPAEFEQDLAPPAVLFARGALPLVDAPRVAIIGTRRCTGVGAGFARELGAELTEAGVVIVSGLALGIDGAAHRGVLDATGAPVGVVGSGLDIVYPQRHRTLWEAVAEQGVLLSEAPLGARPLGWRFPARNRLIAALADLLVVVESHDAGGSMLTVEEALARDVPVMAVPGSVRSPSASGVNRLLSDGCHPVRDATDVLIALGLTTRSRPTRAEQRPDPGPTGRRVLDAFDWQPSTLDHLVVRAGLPVPEVSLTLHRLVIEGWIQEDGPWYERVAG
jgi:DNA processing protein